MAQFVTNASEVLRSSKATREQVKEASRIANRRTADQGVKYTRAEIPPPQGAGKFPGYAARGPLRSAVQASGPVEIPGGVKSEIFMAPNSSEVYQRIHEFGGVIRAKNPSGLLTFKIGGQWVRVPLVRIRPKHYWRDGWANGVKKFGGDFNRFLTQELKRLGAIK